MLPGRPCQARRCTIGHLASQAPQDLRSGYDIWHEAHSTGAGPWHSTEAVPWYTLVWEALERRNLLEGARVLEIGCGGGGFAARLAAGGARSVIGQDFSVVAIKHARERFHRDNLAFEVGDIEQIGFPNGHFDLVVSCETIEHVLNPWRAVSELARVLRQGGTLLLTTPNYMSITGLHRLYLSVTGRKWDEGGQPLVNWTVLPRTIRWLRWNGLVVDRIDGVGWYVPVPRRPGGYAWNPPGWSRAMLTWFAVHQLVEARRASGAESPTSRVAP